MSENFFIAEVSSFKTSDMMFTPTNNNIFITKSRNKKYFFPKFHPSVATGITESKQTSKNSGELAEHRNIRINAVFL